jgi:cytochrome P450
MDELWSCVLWFVAGAVAWATAGEWAIRQLARSPRVKRLLGH